jgi:hypothetical protein
VLPGQRPGDSKKLKDCYRNFASSGIKIDVFALLLALFQGALAPVMGLNLPKIQTILRIFGFFNAADEGSES